MKNKSDSIFGDFLESEKEETRLFDCENYMKTSGAVFGPVFRITKRGKENINIFRLKGNKII